MSAPSACPAAAAADQAAPHAPSHSTGSYAVELLAETARKRKSGQITAEEAEEIHKHVRRFA